MRKQDPKERIKNFEEVALGLIEEEAVEEGKRCIQCKVARCVEKCPVEIDIPKFIKAIAEREFPDAIKIIKEKNSLPGVCGRVCPQETQCEGACILGIKGSPINIGALERFAADWEMNNRGQRSEVRGQIERIDKKVAIIGSGPAGLTCAGDLVKLRYNVTIFESLHLPGGVLVYGIPEFRLPKRIVSVEIDYLKSLGVNIKTNYVIGKILTLKELFSEGFSAIFIGTGAGLPQFMGIEGENLNRVYSANEFLTRANLMKAYLFPEYDTPINIGKDVAVIGGGNTAMDAARVAKRLGARNVYIVYRRTEAEMPARQEERENAKQEGIEFIMLTLPKRILGNDKCYVKGMECLKMVLGEPDSTGRRRPVPVEGSEFIMDVDTIIVAIGQSPNPLFINATPGLKVDEDNRIIVNPQTQEANLKGVYAGGDATPGDDTVIAAMGAGKRAARAIDRAFKTRS